MKNLINEIEKALKDTEKLYRQTSEIYNGYLKSYYRGKIEAYKTILYSLNQDKIKIRELEEVLKNDNNL